MGEQTPLPGQPSRHGHATQLTPKETSFGRLSRRIAFHVLACLAVAGCALSIFCWYLWWVTVQTCVGTYILRQQDSILLTPGMADYWLAYFKGLDISSFSALILAIFFTRLAYSGLRNTLWKRYRDGQAYFEQAYGDVLFPESFEAISIRFGLLGTLLSFLLAAVSQLSSPAVTSSIDKDVTLQQRVAEIAQDVPAEAGAERPAPSPDGQGTSETASALRTSRLSNQMFLLLCASLVSTFVGTFVAYVMMPPLNMLNGYALGAHQQRETDEEAIADDFFRQLDRTTQRLADFETATGALTGAADGLVQYHAATADASRHFGNMADLLQRANHLMEAANKSSEHLGRHLSISEQQSDRLIRHIRRFADALGNPLERMALAAASVEKSANRGEEAFVHLREVARDIRKPLLVINNVSSTTWKLLGEIRTSLSQLAGSEKTQTREISKLAGSFEALNSTLTDVLKEADSLLGEHQREEAEGRELHDMLVAMRRQLGDAVEQLSTSSPVVARQEPPFDRPQPNDLSGSLAPTAVALPVHRSQDRSLWHRLLGWIRGSAGNGHDPGRAREKSGRRHSRRGD